MLTLLFIVLVFLLIAGSLFSSDGFWTAVLWLSIAVVFVVSLVIAITFPFVGLVFAAMWGVGFLMWMIK